MDSTHPKLGSNPTTTGGVLHRKNTGLPVKDRSSDKGVYVCGFSKKPDASTGLILYAFFLLGFALFLEAEYL